MNIALAPYFAELERVNPLRWTGQVTEVVGLLIESRGPSAAIGDFCEVQTADGRRIRTQVIGFRDGRVLSMPLEEIDGLQLGDPVAARSEDARVEVGPGLLGRVIDGFGKPMDDGPAIEAQRHLQPPRRRPPIRSIASTSPSPWSPASAPSTACCPAARASASASSAAAASARARCSAPCRATIRPTSP